MKFMTYRAKNRNLRQQRHDEPETSTSMDFIRGYNENNKVHRQNSIFSTVAKMIMKPATHKCAEVKLEDCLQSKAIVFAS